MPRLSPALLWRARRQSPFLPLLLQTCRDLPSARNELRWIREHVDKLRPRSAWPQFERDDLLKRLCRNRGRGVPLQYVLGSQPFGDLDILCRKGVLIPRPETEAYTAYLAELVCKHGRKTEESGAPMKILDLCTGTGCIPLLLHALLKAKFPRLEITGVDISETALSLAKKNLDHNIRIGILKEAASIEVRFQRTDVLAIPNESAPNLFGPLDIVISNPPYISSSGFDSDTARSVRNWEPKLALVPRVEATVEVPHPEDVFYPKILHVAASSNAKMVVMEVADESQALRVVRLAIERAQWSRVEIWRDWPEQDDPELDGPGLVEVLGTAVSFRGSGNCRAVACFL